MVLKCKELLHRIKADKVALALLPAGVPVPAESL